MSKFFITPNIDEWKDKTEPFLSNIIAYDVHGKRICNKQFYIKYSITHDGSVPDLDNSSILYSNKDGIIELYFDQYSRISMEIYMVSEYDDTILENDIATNYDSELICDNYLLPFDAYITSFSAKYIDDFILSVTDTIPRKYIEVYITKSDDSTARFTINESKYNEYIVTPATLNHVGNNTITISYYDKLLDKTWEYDIIIVSKEKEVKITASYLGSTKEITNIILQYEINVVLTLFDGEKYKTEVLDTNQWEFTTFPQITNKNLGILEIGHNSLRTNVRIPYVNKPLDFTLDVWYEGPPVKVGEKFVPENFRVYKKYGNGDSIMISFNDCEITPEDYTIHEVGNNWFKFQYREGQWFTWDKAAVIGYKDFPYKNLDFKMEYLDPNLHTLINVTDQFDKICTVAGRRWFKWELIMDYIYDTNQFGEYILYAPILAGLSTRYSTIWHIYTSVHEKLKIFNGSSINKKPYSESYLHFREYVNKIKNKKYVIAIQSTLIKTIYDEEEQENGENEESE